VRALRRSSFPRAALLALAILLVPERIAAAEEGDHGNLLDFPVKVSVNAEGTQDPRETAGTIKVLLFFTLLSLLPALLLTMTSFTRIIIVLSFVRRALSLQNLPPNQLLIGIALFMTIFVMAPVFGKINKVAIEPYMNEEITQKQAFTAGMGCLREFMLKHTREKDLGLFVSMAETEQPRTSDDVPTYVLVPAFAVSELKTAFQMGFVIFLPFLVIDMVVSSVLTSMGMFMLPPVIISVPFKILLFVLVDGWNLVIRSLAAGFTG